MQSWCMCDERSDQDAEHILKEVKNMAVHHGGKVGKAGKTLAAKGSSKSAKSKAGTTLANHKANAH